MTADTGYGTSSLRYEVPASRDIISTRAMDALIAVASAGFRLSLVLNAVGTGMANPDCDIHSIAKYITTFSLMLKQTGGVLKDGRPSQAAIDVATEISQHGQLIFEEIKNMTDLSQGRDEKGILRSITIAEKDKWAFKRHKVEYLMAQLEALKLSLALMLQVLQMGRGTVISHQDPSANALAQKAILQDHAEIQNMIVVRHWSLIELRRLYELAELEAREEASSPSHDDPPPSYDAHRAIESNHYTQKANGGGLQLSVVGSPEDNSQAMVRYHEKPLKQLDDAFAKAIVRENQTLGANVNNIVDYLRHEWTHISELDSQRRPSLTTYYESDEEDTTESEYDETHVQGRYIEAPPKKVKKDVRFKARVESDSDEERQKPRHHRPPKKHILLSKDDSSSESESPLPTPSSRRDGDASNNPYNPQEHHDRNPRPYASNGRHYRPEIPNGRPSSRGIPQPAMGPPQPARTGSSHGQWQGTPPMPMPQPPNLRLPSYQGPPFGASPRLGPYIPPGYVGQSPQPPPGTYFPQQQQMRPQPPHPPHQQRPRPHRHRHQSETHKAEDDKRAANKNLKRGLLGGAAVAGILDLLQGLDGI